VVPGEPVIEVGEPVEPVEPVVPGEPLVPGVPVLPVLPGDPVKVELLVTYNVEPAFHPVPVLNAGMDKLVEPTAASINAKTCKG
jgi:hypothetical protein